MVRIVFNDWQPASLPRMPVRDDVTETLASAIRLARVQGTLHDLSGIGEYGLVNFGVEPGFERSAELVVADRPVAAGTVGFTGESWALLVSEVKATVPSRPDYTSTGAVPVLDLEPFHAYDFGRADMFSRQQLKKLHDIHGLMAQNLRRTAAGPMKTQVLDQMTLREALEGVWRGELYRVRSSWAHRWDSEVSKRRKLDQRHSPSSQAPLRRSTPRQRGGLTSSPGGWITRTPRTTL